MPAGPHAHEEFAGGGVPSPGPWGWQCPVCGLENVVRELGGEGGGTSERPCDYCGAVYEIRRPPEAASESRPRRCAALAQAAGRRRSRGDRI